MLVGGPAVVRAPYPSFRQAARLLLLLLVLQSAVGALGSSLAAAAGAALHRTIEAQAATTAAANLLAFWLVVAFGVRRARESWRRVVPLGRVSLAFVLPMVVTLAGAHILLSEVDNLIERVLPAPEALQNLLGGPNDLGGEWLALFVAGVVAPVTEEPLFRGLLLHGFVQRYGSWRAIGATAVLFGAIHLNPWQAPGAAVLGVIFGWWVVRTGSLVPAVLGHAFANVFHDLSITLWHWDAIPGYAIPADQPIVWQPWWFNGLGLLMLVGGLMATNVLLARRPQLAQAAFVRLSPALLAELEASDAIAASTGTPSRVARVLGVLWWIGGWLAYVVLAALTVILSFALLPIKLLSLLPLLAAIALPLLLWRTRTLEPAVRLVAPVLLILLLIALAFFGPQSVRS